MDYLGILGGILGVAGTVGAASAVFYAFRSRAINAIYKEENEALGKQNARYEKDLEVANAKLIAVEEKVKLLTDMVTQAPSIAELTKVISDQNSQVIKNLGDVAKELSHLTKAIGENMGRKSRK